MNRRVAGVALCAIALLVATGCSQLRALVTRPPAEHALPVTEGYVTTGDGIQLFYRVVGAGPDTVVVIHGGPGLHMGTLVGLEPLAAGGTLIFYDQRGGGRSSLPQDPQHVTPALHVSDLEAVLSHFRIERPTLLGHSWGALLAGLYAAAHPQRVGRMILVGPMPLRADPHMPAYFARLPSLLGADAARYGTLTSAWDTTSDPHAVCRELVPILVRVGGASDGTVVNRLTEGVCTAGISADAMRIGWSRTPQWTLAPLAMWDLRERLAAVSAPTLVIYGERDAIPESAVREWVDALRNARFLLIPGTGHYVYAEDPARFAAVIREFLGRD